MQKRQGRSRWTGLYSVSDNKRLRKRSAPAHTPCVAHRPCARRCHRRYTCSSACRSGVTTGLCPVLLPESPAPLACWASTLPQDETYHLVGHSFGGGVALRLAHADLKRISSLCLYEPTAFHLLGRNDPALDEIRTVARASAAAVSSGQHHDATEMFIDYWSGTGAYAALPPSRQALFSDLLPKVPLDFQALMNDPHHAFDYRRISAPSCLITGRASPNCADAVATVLAAALPNSETHKIDAGHMGPLTHPAVVNSIVNEFIRRIDARDKKFGSRRLTA